MFSGLDAEARKHLCNLGLGKCFINLIPSLYALPARVFRGKLPLVAAIFYFRPVMVEAGHPSSRSRAEMKAIDVSPLDANLLDAVVRLVRLLDSPAEAHVLAPLILLGGSFQLFLLKTCGIDALPLTRNSVCDS